MGEKVHTTFVSKTATIFKGKIVFQSSFKLVSIILVEIYKHNNIKAEHNLWNCLDTRKLSHTTNKDNVLKWITTLAFGYTWSLNNRMPLFALKLLMQSQLASIALILPKAFSLSQPFAIQPMGCKEQPASMWIKKGLGNHNDDKLVSIFTSASKGAADEDIEVEIAVHYLKTNKV